MRAHDKAAIRDAKADKRIRMEQLKSVISDLKTTIDELTQMQCDAVEDGECHMAGQIGTHIKSLRLELEDTQLKLSTLFR